MATLTITDLPSNRALDYKAMSAVRGAGGAPWVYGAFRPFLPESDQTLPIVNVFQISATNLTLQTENINVQNSAPSATINVGATQNALTFNLAPTVVPTSTHS